MSRIWTFLRGEPLAHFALAAAALFTLYGAMARPDEEAIRVTSEMARDLVAEREDVLGRRLAPAEREEVVTNFVDEEVLVREAMARGFARRDGKVRQRLVSKMLFLFDQEPPEPSAAELEAFYQAHEQRYRTPPSISFEQTFFETAPEDPERILEALAAGAPPESLGDRYWLGGTFTRVTEAELASSFGPGLARQLTALEPGAWRGPLTSARGTHFARVIERHEARRVLRQALGSGLRQDWAEDWLRQARQRQVDELRHRYRVVVEDGETGE